MSTSFLTMVGGVERGSTSLSLKTNSFVLQDPSDITKTLIFSASGSTSGKTLTLAAAVTSDRTLTFPDITDNIVARTSTDTLTNKTLSGNTATNLINGAGTFSFNSTGTLTAPNATDTLVGRSTSDVDANRLQNKHLDDTSVKFVATSDTTKRLIFGVGNLSTGVNVTITLNLTTSQTLQVPNITATDTFAVLGLAQTLTNKTLNNTNTINVKDTLFTLQDDGDSTKTVNFQLSGISTASNRVWSFPDTTDTFVGLTSTQTLTNKTLSGNTATNLISGSGTLTLNTTGTITVPNATDTLVGRTTTDTGANRLQNKDLSANNTNIVDNSDTTKKIAFTASGNTAAKTLTFASAVTVDRTLTLPDATDTLVGKATTDTFTNKTISTGGTNLIGATTVSGATGTTNVVFSGSPTIATPTITTSATVPLVIGGTGTTSTLTLRSTSGSGTTGADIIFQSGSNGATETVRILNNGNVGIGTATPGRNLDIKGTIASSGDAYVNLNRTDNGSTSGSLLQTGGTNDWIVGERNGASDFNIFSFGTSSNVLTVSRATGNINYQYATAHIGYQYTNTTGNFTISNNLSDVIVDAGAQATLTVTMPASPIDGQILNIMFAGAITTLTVAANSGQTLNGSPTTATANSGFAWFYRSTNTTWYRRQ